MLGRLDVEMVSVALLASIRKLVQFGAGGPQWAAREGDDWSIFCICVVRTVTKQMMYKNCS